MQGLGSEDPVEETPFDNPIEPPPFEFGDRALIVLPGISWDEWVSLWRTAEGMHQSSNFYMGDALLAGSREFGERFAQVVDPKYIHQQRGAMWVCSRIDPARRKPSLSFSLHRELASLEPAEQDRWLDLAEQGAWTVKDLKEEMEAERARKSNGPPEEITSLPNDPAVDGQIPGSEEIGSTWNGSPTFGSVEEITGEPFQIDSGDAQASEAAIPPHDTTNAASSAVGAASADEIRACIAAVRKIANDMILGSASEDAVDEVEAAVLGCVVQDGYTTALGCLTDHERATDLIPPAWRGKITIEFGEHVFGGRAYTVDLRKPGGKQMAAGYGPSLPCAIVESALSAILSDFGHC